jgi:NADH:ubiquinone oxidoreductase subunit 6 (subunit J)
MSFAEIKNNVAKLYEIIYFSGLTLYVLFLIIICLSIILLILSAKPIYLLINFIFLISLICLLFRFYGAEFISIVVIIIYIGVFAVLFLFILIIHDDQEIVTWSAANKKFLGVGGIKLIFFTLLLCLFFLYLICNVVYFISFYLGPFSVPDAGEEIIYFGWLYVNYWPILILCGWLLFFIIIGVVEITRYLTFLKINATGSNFYSANKFFSIKPVWKIHWSNRLSSCDFSH